MATMTLHRKHTGPEPAIARRLAMKAPPRPAAGHKAAGRAGRRLDDRPAVAGSPLTAAFLVAGAIIVASLALWP